MRHVAQGAGRQAEQIHRQPHAENRHQGRRHRAGQARQYVDNGHGHGNQAEHHVQRCSAQPGPTVLEVFQLRQRNDDRQAVDETEHHRMRHHAHQFAELEQPERHHDQTAKQNGSQQVLDTVLHHQRDDHHRHRPGRAGHHARPPAEQRGQRANDERTVKPHQRIEMGHQREGDAFGQQGKRGGEPGQDIGA
ncbi:hypothetical protein D3C84_694340 [compost metagenome]